MHRAGLVDRMPWPSVGCSSGVGGRGLSLGVVRLLVDVTVGSTGLVWRFVSADTCFVGLVGGDGFRCQSRANSG